MYDIQLTLSSREFSKWCQKCSGLGNKCLVAYLTPYGGCNWGSGPPNGGSSVLHLHRQQNIKNIVLSIEMIGIDLPWSPDRESCPRPHLKQKQWSDYAICRLKTRLREVEVQAREYCLPSVIAVLRYVEHAVKKCQVHRRHRVCIVVREYHRLE
jgi:hypothetical protein